MMNDQDSSLAMNAICHAASMIQNSWQESAWERSRPSVTMKPKVFVDGNQWCALYGDNLQDGVAGFGKSPADAMYDFDRKWSEKISPV